MISNEVKKDFERIQSGDNAFGLTFDKNHDFASVDGTVREIQTALNSYRKKHDQAEIAVDGGYGRETIKALIDFQKENGLNPTGVFERKTIKRMLELNLLSLDS